MSPLALAVTLILSAVGAALLILRVLAVTVRDQSQPLHAGKGITFIGTVEEPALREAFVAATNCLARVWGKAVVDHALENLTIRLLHADTMTVIHIACGWTPGLVITDSGFGALCHALAHQVEHAANGNADTIHMSWEERGVWAADRRYRTWLALNAEERELLET